MNRHIPKILSALTVFAGSCSANPLREEEIVAATIILEAGGESGYGQCAVYDVIANRAKNRDISMMEVCLEWKQFSCWNTRRVQDGVDEARAHEDWELTYNYVMNIDRYRVNAAPGATHYHNTSVDPAWADPSKIVVRIGNHIFYKL